MSDFDERVRDTGLRLFSLLGDPPSILRKEYWTGKLLAWCMEDEAFRVEAFRFIDVFPALAGAASVIRHVREYFLRPGVHLPASLAGIVNSLSPDSLKSRIAVWPVRRAIESMARQFIAGGGPQDALPGLQRLRARGMAFTVDLLGEAVVSEKEADEYLGRYERLLDLLGDSQKKWRGLGSGSSEAGGEMDWGVSPRIHISVKVSAMYSRMDPCAFEFSVATAGRRLRRVLSEAISRGAFVTFDMEYRALKNLTIALYKSLLEESAFAGYPHTGIAVQAYLRESEQDLLELIRWGRDRKQPFTVRLVKGAYWDSEVIGARQNNWPIPVFTSKHATDANFERLGQIVLENHDIAVLACASHNIRSIAAMIETARDLSVPPGRLEYQVLYGMAEPIRDAMLKAGLPVRVYAPVGELLPGMSYLVRRLLENTANESFLRQGLRPSLSDDRSRRELLRNPVDLLKEAPEEHDPYDPGLPESDSGIDEKWGAFRNEPRLDWTTVENRRRFKKALHDTRNRFPLNIPVLAGGKEIAAGRRFRSINPNAPDEAVALVASAGRGEAEHALREAKAAFSHWRDTPAEVRAEYLFRAAAAARRRRFELAALQVLEVGKGWSEADADVCEAIDFLEYYGREMIRLGVPRRMGRAPGEESLMFYEPRGVAVVIPPWNFPMAIPVGMTAAAIVAGNTAVLKPASQSPASGFAVAEIFREAELPPGVLNFLPGPGGEIGDMLVSHPDVALIAFTGSRAVGVRIVGLAPQSAPNAPCIKQVIAEMGGKNAIIVDEDADLDEALVHILNSAFSYQGQKCSACSRLIVLESIRDRLLIRLKEAVEDLRFGPPEDPENFIGAVIEENAKEKILDYIRIGKTEGKLLVEARPPQGQGYFVPLAILTDIRPEHRLAQEEIFGPVLSVIGVRHMDEALAAANSTSYALTGGFFSRSPQNIARAQREFRVGNLYINRGITGAVVGRHPFGGFAMSGIGSKTGGPDYLLQFMVPRNTVENTIRRGFAPTVKNRRRSDPSGS